MLNFWMHICDIFVINATILALCTAKIDFPAAIGHKFWENVQGAHNDLNAFECLKNIALFEQFFQIASVVHIRLWTIVRTLCKSVFYRKYLLLGYGQNKKIKKNSLFFQKSKSQWPGFAIFVSFIDLLFGWNLHILGWNFAHFHTKFSLFKVKFD